MLVGTALALSIGVFLGWITRRASRSWAEWQNAKAAVPVARKAAYANVRSAAFNWFLLALIVIILMATIALRQRGSG